MGNEGEQSCDYIPLFVHQMKGWKQGENYFFKLLSSSTGNLGDILLPKLKLRGKIAACSLARERDAPGTKWGGMGLIKEH